MIIPDFIQKWFFYYLEGQILLLPLLILYLVGLSNKNIAISTLTKLHKFLVLLSLSIPFIFLSFSLVHVNSLKFTDSNNSYIERFQSSIIKPETTRTVGANNGIDRSLPVTNNLLPSISRISSEVSDEITVLLIIASFAGFLLFLCKILKQNLYERNLVTNSLFTSCNRRVTIISSNAISTPFSSGLINTRIFLPLNITEAEKEVILSHELNHIHSGDIFWIYLDNLIGHLFWYNPMARLLSKRGQCIREFQCDLTILNKIDPLHYANTLYSTSIKTFKNKENLILTAQWERKDMLKTRINLILNGKTKTTKRMKLNLSVLLIISIMAFPVMLSSNQIISNREVKVSGTEDIYNKISLTFDNPVSIGYLTNEFGPQIHPLNGEWYLHKGIDIAYGMGTPIFTAAAGTIIDKGYEPNGFGYYVEIDHGNGYSTRYCHMQTTALFDIDDVVKRGDNIGQMGNSGLSNGPHLHFEIHYENEPIDPEQYITLSKRSDIN